MNNNQKALFLPFMQITTGHHHVADVLMDELLSKNHEMACQKVDILSYSYGRIESIISHIYLLSIRHIPQLYNWIYGLVANREVKGNRKILFKILFSYFFKRLLKETNPDILIFTHSLPSHIASLLKNKNKLDAITVNVYTDYFVNRIWGIDGIDYHIVPSEQVKIFLKRKGVKEENIFVTGIPVHTVFNQKSSQLHEKKEKINVLVTGGSLGVGDIDRFLPKNSSNKNLNYFVLCGKNKRLYEKLIERGNLCITPISYIESKQEMNRIYDEVDAVLTKPGGVTVSECFRKEKVVFISDSLPGQEKINLDILKNLGIAIPINLSIQSAEDEIASFFYDEFRQRQYQINLESYNSSLEKRSMSEILDLIMKK